ncbi:hypothetical protein DFQ28_004249 [Apophysomyces sp. BC1034]|nr:hypothetical protein DFQ28_004249 [Apophysomyces sp. BC1034]
MRNIPSLSRFLQMKASQQQVDNDTGKKIKNCFENLPVIVINKASSDDTTEMRSWNIKIIPETKVLATGQKQ